MLTTVIVLLLVCGLAAKQASFILLYGSVFDWLRDTISRCNVEGDNSLKCWFFRKLGELFTCNLCMTAQTSIWLCAVPVMVIIHFSYPHPFELLFGGELPLAVEIFSALLATFLVSMANAAIAMAFWGLSEYVPQRLEVEKKFYQDQLKLKRLAVLSGQERSSEQK